MKGPGRSVLCVFMTACWLVASTKSGEDAGKGKELIEKAEGNCLISNSMKATVTLEPIIH